MEGLIVILLYTFKLAFLASLACVKTKVFSLKSEVKKAYLHAHKRILIMPSIMKEVYTGITWYLHREQMFDKFFDLTTCSWSQEDRWCIWPMKNNRFQCDTIGLNNRKAKPTCLMSLHDP